MTVNISPKEFYSLVLEADPIQAFQYLSSIPHDSSQPYVSFRNEESKSNRRFQETALHAAARAGHTELVQLLLDSNSDIDARKNDDATAIFVASQQGHGVVELLLAAGADKDAAKNDGVTPICAASQSGHDTVVGMLLAAGANINAAANNGATPIIVASYHGHDRVVELLLAAGVNNNASMHDGSTPIFVASFYGHYRVVELLLAAGADKDARKNDGASPIYVASQNGHHRVVELLIITGAEKNTGNKDGVTPIYMASYHGHEIVVELLLAAGADKDAAKKTGATPIYVASQNGYHRVVELLLAAGAVKNAAKNSGSTPLDIAYLRGHQSVVEVLLAAGARKSASKNQLWTRVAGMFRSPLRQSTIDAFRSRQAQLVSQLAEKASTLLRSMHNASFNPLQHTSFTPAPQSPHSSTSVDFLNLDNLLIPPESLCIESTSFAEGADGKVYKAEYLGIYVAVKKLKSPNSSLQRELEKWCHFRHPNILLLYGFSQPSNSLPLIVMELMDSSLYDLLNDYQIDLSWESRLKMAHGIAAGLVYLHENRNIIHRDIKSLNILVKGRDNEVKIADFGASRANSSLTSKVAGTPRWLAPELYDNYPPSFAVDIYALGITLNELSTRQLPFRELGNNTAAIMKAVTSYERPKMDPFPSIALTPAWYPLFESLILRCWVQDPLQRPSATLVLQELTQMLVPTYFSSCSASPAQPRPSIHYGSLPSFSGDFPPSSSQIDSIPPLASPTLPSTSSPFPLTADWTVRSWLSAIGIGNDIILLFENNDLDDREDIRRLSEQDLRELGISVMGTRKKILRYAEQL